MSDLIERQAVLDLCESKDPDYKVIHFKEDVECLPSEKTCEDAISRQAAIDAIENEQVKIMRSDWAIDQAKFSAMSEIRALIEQLPSVSTEKTGRWIFDERIDKHYYCSECKAMGVDYFDYCPYCGAKMEVEE